MKQYHDVQYDPDLSEPCRVIEERQSYKRLALTLVFVVLVGVALAFGMSNCVRTIQGGIKDRVESLTPQEVKR